MSKPWGGIGAWAADAEKAEAEEQERQLAGNSRLSDESQSYPSLKEAAASKPKKKNKAITLLEFNTGNYSGTGRGKRDFSFDSKKLTTEELLTLPTGPKERSVDDLDYGRLGGGFRSYGRNPARERPPENEGTWGSSGRKSYGGFDDERRGGARVSDFDQPSRADEVDNWASMKKPTVSLPDSGRRERYGSLGGGSSRADDVDNWAAGKKPLPARSGGLGSSFKDPGIDSDRWSRGGLRFGAEPLERHRILLDPRGYTGDVAAAEAPTEPARVRPSPFGSARPREEVLAEKGLDWKKMDSEIESRKSSRPTSSQSSRPSSAQSNRPDGPAAAPALTQVPVEGAPKPRPKVNPFGDAKPREVLLQEQGKDWRKIDLELEHRGADRPETEEEKTLKEEIDQLKKDLTKDGDVNQESAAESIDQVHSLREQIACKERDLELLTWELDDKVRFGQRGGERPWSGSGMVSGGVHADRPPSRSGFSEDSRSMEFVERPRSGGMADVWTKPGEDRRGGFHGTWERGFQSSRDADRFKSRERW